MTGLNIFFAVIITALVLVCIYFLVSIRRDAKSTSAPAPVTEKERDTSNVQLEIAKAEQAKAEAEAEKAKAEAAKAEAEAAKAKTEENMMMLDSTDAIAKMEALVNEAKAMFESEAHAKRIAKNAALIAESEAELAIMETRLAKAKEERHFMNGTNAGHDEAVSKATDELAYARTRKSKAISAYSTAFAAKAMAEKAVTMASISGEGLEEAEPKLNSAKDAENEARMALQEAYAEVREKEAALAKVEAASKAAVDSTLEKDVEIEDLEKKIKAIKNRIAELEA